MATEKIKYHKSWDVVSPLQFMNSQNQWLLTFKKFKMIHIKYQIKYHFVLWHGVVPFPNSIPTMLVPLPDSPYKQFENQCM